MNYRIPTLISALTTLVLAACSSTPQMPQLQTGPAAIYLATDKDKLTQAEPLELAVAFEGLDNQEVAKVEYFADQNKIGETTEAPFNFTWTQGGTSGQTLNLSAKASLLDGRNLSSEALSLPVSSASEVSTMAEPVGYTLSVLTHSVSLNQGASTTIPVYIKRTGGYDKEVKVYAGIGTPGVSATFNPSSLTGSQSQSTLTISASHDALAETPRDFLVVSRGIGETKSQFHKLTLTVKGIHGMKVRSAFPGNRLSKVVALPSGELLVANIVKRYESGNWRYYGEVLKLNFDLQVIAKVQLPLSNTYEVLVTGLSLGSNGVLYVSGCGKTGQYSAAQGFVAAIGLADFKLMNSFGSGGLRLKVMHSGSIYSCANAVDASGNKVVTAGYVNTAPARIGVSRFNSSGSDDNIFSGDGTLTTVIPNTNGSGARDVCINGFGTYVAGYAKDIYNRERSVMLNYMYDGTLNPSFSGDGILAFDPDQGNNILTSMACYNSYIVAAGYATTAGGKSNFAVSRIDGLTGTLVKSFGGDGMVTTSFGSGRDVAQEVLAQADGSIIAAGFSTEFDGDRTIALARYKMDGTLVQGFGIGGKVIEKGILGDTIVTGMAIKSNGNIVVVGYSDATLPQGVIVEYLP